MEHIQAALNEAAAAVTLLAGDLRQVEQIENASRLLIDCLENGGTAFSCGNGGSLCDAMHFAEELTGRFRRNRAGMAAVAISDPSHITCVANDFGFEYIFSRYIESHGNPNDLLLAISTSGESKNVLMAASAARDRGMKIISLTGKTNSTLSRSSDIDICVPAGDFSDRVQELHIKIIHILVESAERKIYPENYSA